TSFQAAIPGKPDQMPPNHAADSRGWVHGLGWVEWGNAAVESFFGLLQNNAPRPPYLGYLRVVADRLW
ncbi:hypothetical protein ACFOX2_12445, partial [Corynebacterium marambiense]|uniref:hypothetical protein n=1 Tax=Corynebacterium marambiense TaxID=2765364 RepID=UPI00361824BE